MPFDQTKGLNADEPELASGVEPTLTVERIVTALETLDPRLQEVVVLRFLAGLSLREVAAALDKTVTSVESMQYRGLVALRGELEKDEREIATAQDQIKRRGPREAGKTDEQDRRPVSEKTGTTAERPAARGVQFRTARARG
jgi:hypothetical protein